MMKALLILTAMSVSTSLWGASKTAFLSDYTGQWQETTDSYNAKVLLEELNSGAIRIKLDIRYLVGGELRLKDQILIKKFRDNLIAQVTSTPSSSLFFPAAENRKIFPFHTSGENYVKFYTLESELEGTEQRYKSNKIAVTASEGALRLSFATQTCFSAGPDMVCMSVHQEGYPSTLNLTR